MSFRFSLLSVLVLSLASLSMAQESQNDKDWIVLFNGKDLSGWKLRQEKVTLTRFVDSDGKEIVGAKKTTLGQTAVARDAKGKDLPDAKIIVKGGKKIVTDAEGNVIPGAKVALVGGRAAIVTKAGEEVTAKAIQETIANPNGWTVEKDELRCAKPHGGNDIYTDQKFTDFELHIEFQATSNSGVYLQGRYEIQVNDDYNAKPKLVEKDGKTIEVFDTHQCGAIYGRIAPSKNMAKPAKEWQSFDVVFRGARGEKGKVAQKARITLIWNGEKVIDNAEIDGPTGSALAGKVIEPGPLLLQGDHGKVAFRNIKIRPLTSR